MVVCDELADAALGGTDPVRLTEVFARLVGKRIMLLNTAFRLWAQAGRPDSVRGLRWNRTDPSVDRLLRALEASRQPLRIPAIPGSLGLRDDEALRIAMLRPAPSDAPAGMQRIVAMLPGAAAAARNGALVVIVVQPRSAV